MRVAEKIAKANIGIGNGKRLAPPTDPLDTGVEVEAETAADGGVDDGGDIDVDSLDDDDNVLDGTTEGDVATLEGVATGGCSDVFGKVPTVIVDVTLEAVEWVRDAGIGIFEVAAGSGLSNEPDIPTRLTSERLSAKGSSIIWVHRYAPEVRREPGIRSAIIPFQCRRRDGNVANGHLKGVAIYSAEKSY
jgi:hypothetical protein